MVLTLVAVASVLFLIWFGIVVSGPYRERVKQRSKFKKVFDFYPPGADEHSEVLRLLQQVVDRRIMGLAESIAIAREEMMDTEVTKPWYKEMVDNFYLAEENFQGACRLAKDFGFRVPNPDALYATVTAGL